MRDATGAFQVLQFADFDAGLPKLAMLGVDFGGLPHQEADVEVAGIVGAFTFARLHEVEREAVLAGEKGEGVLAAQGVEPETEEAGEEIGERGDVVGREIEVVSCRRSLSVGVRTGLPVQRRTT